MADLSSRVKYFRAMKNLSVRELARRAGVSASYVYAIEAGSRGTNMVKLEKIAQALEVPLSELWRGRF